jgi:hypothetical protein
MPQQIPIQVIANQAFTAILDGNTWDFAIKSTNGVMSVSLTLNSVDLIDNARAVAGMRIIPSRYEEAGNFAFYTQNFDLPDYNQFNITQALVYYSAAELAAIRTPPAPPITATYFNPIAALPLRFSPKNY